jgi:hypothetical protein
VNKDDNECIGVAVMLALTEVIGTELNMQVNFHISENETKILRHSYKSEETRELSIKIRRDKQNPCA